MQEVSGSIPLSSTKFLGSLSSRGLGHDPFTVGTGVRIPVGTPQSRKNSDIIRTLSWGISSAGRALAWHARGQRFDPAILHQEEQGPHRLEAQDTTLSRSVQRFESAWGRQPNQPVTEFPAGSFVI